MRKGIVRDVDDPEECLGKLRSHGIDGGGRAKTHHEDEVVSLLRTEDQAWCVTLLRSGHEHSTLDTELAHAPLHPEVCRTTVPTVAPQRLEDEAHLELRSVHSGWNAGRLAARVSSTSRAICSTSSASLSKTRSSRRRCHSSTTSRCP